MLLCKQEEAEVQLNAEQADWKDDIDDESDDQELEAHYMYMAQLQEVTPDQVDNCGPIFDDEPMHKVQNNNDNYNVFAMENEHPEQPKSSNDIYLAEQGDTNITIDSSDICYDRAQDDQDETDDLDQEQVQAKLDKYNDVNYAVKGGNCIVQNMKDELCVHQNHSIMSQAKEAQIKLYKTREDKELDKVIALENKVKVLNDIVYKTGQSVQTINMLNRNCKTSFAKPEFLKQANARILVCFDNRPFDYDQLNNLYDLFVPQREKSAEQHYFPKTSKMSHTSSNKEFSKESFRKQTTLLEKRMDESIPWDQKCKSSKELFKIKKSVDTIFDGVERCKQTIAKRTYFGNIDPFIQNTIEGNFGPQISRLNADLENFHLCLNEEMVADLRYFNSLEHEVDTLKSQLETQKTQFLNEIDRLSREYYYADHMNAILGVYTDLDEFTNLQCDYVETKTVATDSTVKKSRNITRKLYEQVSKTCSWWYPKYTPSGYNWKPKSQKGNVNPNISMPLGNASRTANILEHIRLLVFHCVQTPLFLILLQLVEIILFIVDSGCSKHMTENLKLLTNFVEKFLGTVKFRNDQIAPILGYGDLVQGTITIKRVYYVEGLNHNLFSVGQFCDADLEVAFWKSTCYIRDLKGNDLLTGSRGTDLYSISLQDSTTPNPICLMAKATSSQAWLWHRRLSHLNFDTINLLLKNNIVNGLPKLKFVKDRPCSSCELGKAKGNSFHTKTTPSSKRWLQLIHMDLCGPMRVESINGKKYVLV
ncbi:retrovirus-related pol polyprotein from transposon TNT 1-94, partial [Tanacetum coccineum]